MATSINAEVRLTDHYITRYSHLDQWGQAFTFKLLGGRQVKVSEDLEGGSVYYHRVIGSKRASQRLQAQALQDTFSTHGCHHVHDCCGCRSVSVTVRRLKRGVFGMWLRVSYNY